MDINNFPQKEIINNDINIPLSNGETSIKENNAAGDKENDNNIIQPKLKLKKKVNKLKKPTENNNIQEDQVPIPNIDIEVIQDNNIIENNNILNNNDENNIEVKIEGDKGEVNKGYLDDDLEDEDNKKLYLRVIKRMEKTYGVPIISAEIKGEPIEDIELEENIRPILVGKERVNKKEIAKNNFVDNRSKYNIDNKIINNHYKIKENIINNPYNIPNKRINNHINNNYYKEKRQYINNNAVYNNNNLLDSPNLNYNSYNNYRQNSYLNNPGLYNKNINNNDFMKKYRYPTGKNFNNINPRYIPNKGSSLHRPRKHSYEKIDKDFQKRLNYKYPIYNANRIDNGMNKFNYKNLKYYGVGNEFSNYSNLKNLNQKKYNYPLKKTYYISYNNKNKQYSNFSNSKPNKNRNNYFNYNSLNINRTPIIPKTNFKYLKEHKNNNKNYNFSNPLFNNNQLYINNFVNNYKNKNPHLNKSQNIPKRKNILYNYNGNLNKYNYGRNNKNLLSLTQEVISNNNKLSITPFHSYNNNNNNYHLNFNYSNEDNINDDYNSDIQMPKKEIKFTYYINSRYN